MHIVYTTKKYCSTDEIVVQWCQSTPLILGFEESSSLLNKKLLVGNVRIHLKPQTLQERQYYEISNILPDTNQFHSVCQTPVFEDTQKKHYDLILLLTKAIWLSREGFSSNNVTDRNQTGRGKSFFVFPSEMVLNFIILALLIKSVNTCALYNGEISLNIFRKVTTTFTHIRYFTYIRSSI